MRDERCLQRMQAFALGYSLNRRDLSAVMHDCERQAREYALAVEQHGTGAAGALVATFFGSGEVERFA